MPKNTYKYYFQAIMIKILFLQSNYNYGYQSYTDQNNLF